MIRSVRLLSVVLAMLGMASSAWAVCAAAGGDPNMEQMPCCQRHHQVCGPHGSAIECCQHHAPDQQAASLAKMAQSLQVEAHMSLVSVSLLHVLTSRDVRFAAIQFFVPTASAGPPPFIAFSTLLI